MTDTFVTNDSLGTPDSGSSSAPGRPSRLHNKRVLIAGTGGGQGAAAQAPRQLLTRQLTLQGANT